MNLNYPARRNLLGAASLAPSLADASRAEAAGRKYSPELGSRRCAVPATTGWNSPSQDDILRCLVRRAVRVLKDHEI